MFGGHAGGDEAFTDTAGAVERGEPVGITFHEVIIDRDDVAGAAGPAGEDGSKAGGKGFAFAGLHLGEVTVVQGKRAHDLHRVGMEAELAPGHFADGGECSR